MERSNNIDEIIKHLFVSNWESSIDSRKLRRHDIRANISVEKEPKTEDTLQLYREEEIDFLWIPIDDVPNAPIEDYFDKTFDFIDFHIQKGNNVLVNCAMGISRSVTIILNYLIRKTENIESPEKLVDELVLFMRSRRPIINPNPGFRQKLVQVAINLQKNLNKFPSTNNMCENMKNPDGSPSNVICLGSSDFDSNGNIVSFPMPTGVVMFWAEFCGHCQHAKPEFTKLASMLPTGMKAFSVDTVANKDLMMKMNPQTWGYSARGVPTIVGYYKGKFYSEYAPTNDKFRTAEDLLEYASGLGTAQVDVI